MCYDRRRAEACVEESAHLCWLFIFKVTEPGSIPYRTHSACALVQPKTVTVTPGWLALPVGLVTCVTCVFECAVTVSSTLRLAGAKNRFKERGVTVPGPGQVMLLVKKHRFHEP